MKTTIRDLAQRAKALAAQVTAATSAANTATNAVSAAATRLAEARAEKYKTAKAKANQRERVTRLAAALRDAKVADRATASAMRKAVHALELGPKVHLLAICTARAKAAGAHLDMTGKDACIIPSWDDSHIVREPAKHVWKNSGTECYWSKGRSKDIEYVRATRDNHITSYCVITGRMVRGVVHTTEWSLRAPAGMEWSVKDKTLRISAPPSKLVTPLGRTITAPESPAITGLGLAAQSYREAYARIKDQQYARGPKVRAAVRAVARHRGLGWVVGKEIYQGKDTAFAARRDGEKYHFSSADTTCSAASVLALVETIQRAFARRDQDKIDEARRAEQTAEYLRCETIREREMTTTLVTLDDSRRAGNCVEGALAFAEKKLHLSRDEILAGGYLFTVRAERLLNAANGDRAAVERAVKAAWMRETTVSI